MYKAIYPITKKEIDLDCDNKEDAFITASNYAAENGKYFNIYKVTDGHSIFIISGTAENCF